MANPAQKRELRIEDPALLTGKGRFTGDPAPKGQAFAVFVRAPMAAADIAGINSAAAKAASGVLAVLTSEDLAGLGSLAWSRRSSPRRWARRWTRPSWLT